MRQIMELVDKLLKEEKDEDRKKLLSQIREIARGATYAYPYPQGRKEEDEEEDAGKTEKAGRKISTNRLSKLKKLMEELQRIISEVDPSQDKGKQDDTDKDKDAITKKLDAMEETMKEINEIVGVKNGDEKDGKEKEPTLADTVEGLSKRLKAIEDVPSVKTSIDGQEKLADEKNDKGVWKGLI